MDFVSPRTKDGRPQKILTVINDLAIKVERQLRSQDIFEQLDYQLELPGFIRSDNDPKLTSKVIQN